MRNIDNIKFNQFELLKLLKKLSFETGINFNFYREKFVKKRIKSRMFRLKLTNARSYLDYIMENPSEIKKFLTGFTINTSYLFRNREIYEKLAYLIYECLKATNKISDKNLSGHNGNGISLLQSRPILRERNIQQIIQEFSIYKKLKNNLKSPTTINIWSCACASGEEPYSLAIMFDDFLKHSLNFPNYKIVASDIDENILKNAQKGIYIEESMKEVPKIYELKHFRKIKDDFGTRYSICNEIKKQVEFIQEDVTKGHKKSYRYDIVFCRYFLIYTDKSARDRILNIIENQLALGGILILGKTETLFRSRLRLKLIDSKNHIYLKTSYN
ncbi:MAG: CheR family methyltransferase [Promethearchaeota archaeon]